MRMFLSQSLEVDQINVRRKEVDLGYEFKGTGVYAAPKYETTDLKKKNYLQFKRINEW